MTKRRTTLLTGKAARMAFACGDPSFQADFLDVALYHRNHAVDHREQLAMPQPDWCEALIPGTPDE